MYPPYNTALLLSTLVKEKLTRGGGFVPVTAGDDHSPVTVERNMHDNTVLYPHIITVKKVSSGDDHFHEAVEIDEHIPLKFQIYNTQHTQSGKLWCDVNYE